LAQTTKIDTFANHDHVTATLRETKAKLSEKNHWSSLPGRRTRYFAVCTGKELLYDVKASGADQKIDTLANCDYSDYMIATLRETKAKLSEMVRLASQGEEVVITVHGKEVAKLVPVPSRERRVDREKWLKRLATLRKKTWTGRYGKTAQEIQDEDRADRI